MSADEIRSEEAPVQDEPYEQFDAEILSEAEERLFDLVIYLVQGIVAHPDEVEVEEFLDEVGSVYAVRVHPEDVGRVIGKEGRVANALRQVVKAAATKTGTRVSIEIVTDDQPITVADSDEVDEAPAGDEPGAE